MSKVISLTKVLLKSLYDMGGTSRKGKRKKDSNTASYIAVFGIVFLFVALPFAFVAFAIGAGLKYMDAVNTIWYLFIPLAIVMIIVLSVFSVISVFFLSMDNSSLLPLPLKPWQIIAARLVTTLLLVYSITCLFLLPIFIGLGIGIGGGVDYYVCAVIVTFALPLIPVSLWGIILTLINRVFSFAKHKDAFTYITMLIGLGIGLAVSFGSSSLFRMIEMDPTDIAAAIQGVTDTIGIRIATYVPVIVPAIKAFTADSAIIRILFALLFVVISLVFIVLFMLIGNKLYIKTIMGTGENAAKKRVLTAAEFAKGTKRSSCFWSLTRTEWQLIARSPIYFLNLILIVFLMPIIMVASMAVSFIAAGVEGELNTVTDFITNFKVDMGNSLNFAIALAILLFFGSVNMISSTAISRMGNSSGFWKAIPVAPKIIIRSKIFWGIILSLISTIFYLLIVVVLGTVTFYDAILLFVTSGLILIAINYFAFYLDLARPFLNWTNETYAVKNNMNGIIYMFGTWVGAGLMVLIGFIISLIPIGFTGYIFAAILVIVFLFVIAFLVKRERIPVNKLFRKL